MTTENILRTTWRCYSPIAAPFLYAYSRINQPSHIAPKEIAPDFGRVCFSDRFCDLPSGEQSFQA